MKKHHTLTITLWLSLLSATLGMAASQTTFSGQWILDKTQSAGVPADMTQRMKVEQSGDRLEVETDIYQGDNISMVNDTYRFEQSTEYATQLPTGEKTMARRTVQWNAARDGFTATDVANYDTANGKVTVTTVRKWQMASDGKTLVIELSRTSPTGTTANKRTFKRK